jgi:uncharacterized protein YndB with AHSA1/START domain
MGIEIGILAVRRSVLINATPGRVWQEFETLERMQAWFGYPWEQDGRRGHTLLTYEPRLGGKVELEVTHDGRRRRFGGRIVVFEPARELTFEDAWIPNDDGWDAPTYITIRLTAALGGTLVELFHHAIERIGEGAAELHLGFEMGWTAYHLEALRRIVEG